MACVMSGISWRVLLVAIGIAVVAAVPLQAAKWTKLQTADVVVYSDASEKDVVEFTIQYTAFRKVFREMFPSDRHPPPATVLLFRRLSGLHDYLKPDRNSDSRTVAFTTEVDGDALIAIAVDSDRKEMMRMTIEFDTVWQLGRVGYFLPIWMSQGAGEVLSSLEVKKTSCVIGDGPAAYADQWLDYDALKWSKLFNVSRGSKEYSGPEATGHFHAQAWAVMHCVLLDRDSGPEEFRTLAGKLRETEGLKAVEDAFGVPEKGINDYLLKHFQKKRTTREFPFDSGALRSQLHAVPAPEAEVRVQLANLLFATKASDGGATELATAQSQAPDSAAVNEALARRALFEGDRDRAARLYRKAIDAGSTSSMAYLRSAEQRLNDNGGGMDRAGDGSPEVEKAIGEIRKALTLDPGSNEGYRLLGRAFFVRTKLAPEDVEELSHGVGNGEGGQTARYYRALLYSRLGQRDQFGADLRKVVSDRETPERLRRVARDQLEDEIFRYTSKAVESLVQEKKYDEARELIGKALQDEAAEGAAAKFEQMAAWVSETQDVRKVQSLYNERKWGAFEKEATAFLEKYPKSRVMADIRRLIDRARSRQAKQSEIAPAGGD